MIFKKRRTAKDETLHPGIKRGTWLTTGNIRFFISLFLCLIIFGGIAYTLFYGFDVQKIEFIGEGMEAQFNRQLITGNIIFFPGDKVKADLLAEYPQLKDVVIQKHFPHTITIIPVLRKPSALLVTVKASYGIDKDGKVLGLGYAGPLLPELRIDVPTVTVGMTLRDPKIIQSLSFIEKTAPLISVTSITFDSDSLSLRAISDKTEILFTQDQNIDTLIATLQTIITGVRIKGTMPKIIDIRFSKPVINF